VGARVPAAARRPAGRRRRQGKPRPSGRRLGRRWRAFGTGKIAVPMQGTIVKVNVEPSGDAVEAGQPVVVLEAMKMENNVASDVDGTVTEVKVEPGQAVGSGDVLVVITPTEG
jgi:acetyl-CoA/propionyl-CoA carboxylase biotin carboxyl carrier protein